MIKIKKRARILVVVIIIVHADVTADVVVDKDVLRSPSRLFDRRKNFSGPKGKKMCYHNENNIISKVIWYEPNFVAENEILYDICVGIMG